MSSPPGSVVAGVDDAPDSTAAVTAAAEEARLRGRPLRLVRALPMGAESVRRAATERLDAARGSVHHLLPEEDISAVVREGPADLVLLHESRTAALVVVGSTRSDGLDEVAAALVRRASCPVFVARRGPAEGRLVVGVDGAPGTAALLAVALEEAEVRGTSLLVLHAWDHEGPRHDEAAIDAAERDLLEGYVGPLRAASATVPVELKIAHGSPVTALLEEARSAAVVVLGRHAEIGRGGTVETVAAGSGCAVLVVPVAAATSVPHSRRTADPAPAG